MLMVSGEHVLLIRTKNLFKALVVALSLVKNIKLNEARLLE